MSGRNKYEKKYDIIRFNNIIHECNKIKELILPPPMHLDILINNFQYCAYCRCQYNKTSIDHIKQFYDLLYIEYTNNFIIINTIIEANNIKLYEYEKLIKKKLPLKKCNEEINILVSCSSIILQQLNKYINSKYYFLSTISYYKYLYSQQNIFAKKINKFITSIISKNEQIQRLTRIKYMCEDYYGDYDDYGDLDYSNYAWPSYYKEDLFDNIIQKKIDNKKLYEESIDYINSYVEFKKIQYKYI